jgi:hypothetical protein
VQLPYTLAFRQMTCSGDDAPNAAHWEPAASAAKQAGGGGVALAARLRLECRVTGSAAVLLTPDVLRQFSSILTALLQVRWPLAVNCACRHRTTGDAGGSSAFPMWHSSSGRVLQGLLVWSKGMQPSSRCRSIQACITKGIDRRDPGRDLLRVRCGGRWRGCRRCSRGGGRPPWRRRRCGRRCCTWRPPCTPGRCTRRWTPPGAACSRRGPALPWFFVVILSIGDARRVMQSHTQVCS